MSDTLTDLRSFGLGDGDARLVLPHLSHARFGAGQRIQRADERTSTCHFVTSGLASVVCERHGSIEVGTVSSPGFVGVSMLLGSEVTCFPIDAVTAVTCLSIASSTLRSCMEASPSLRDAMLYHVDVALQQILARAACHAMHAADARLASWILRHHHACGDPVRLTHEALAKLMGVRRATVTNAVHVLEGHRAITATRTQIKVRDALALHRCACECHDLPAPPTEVTTLDREATLIMLDARPRARPPNPRMHAPAQMRAIPSAPVGTPR